MDKLTVPALKSEAKPRRFSDGDGLYLHVQSNGRKNWVLHYMHTGKLRNMGLGVYPTVSLAQAREKAQDVCRVMDCGADPLAARRLEKGRKDLDRTFKAAAGHLIEAQKAGWSNAKHAEQWTSTLTTYRRPRQRHGSAAGRSKVPEVEHHPPLPWQSCPPSCRSCAPARDRTCWSDEGR